MIIFDEVVLCDFYEGVEGSDNMHLSHPPALFDMIPGINDHKN